MNGNIIDPMWFYFLNVVDNLGFILGGVLLISFIGFGVLAIITALMTGEGFDNKDEEYQGLCKWRKVLGIILVISALTIIVVPDSETLIKMKLAEFGTYENVTTIIENIEQMADRIIDQMGGK